MNKLIQILITPTLIVLLLSGCIGPRGGRGGGGNPIADLATVAVIGGITYYVLDGIFYKKNEDKYVVVTAPLANTNAALSQLDYNGKRYYVNNNHFFVRDIEGNYIEVPKPEGL